MATTNIERKVNNRIEWIDTANGSQKVRWQYVDIAYKMRMTQYYLKQIMRKKYPVIV